MTGGLQPYLEYQDSGMPWLGQVPVHWELVRMKHLFHERNMRGYPHEQLLAATQTKGVVRKEDFENRTVLAMKDLQNLKLVRVNDFVVSLRSFQGGIEYARHQGIISPAYTVLYPADQETHGYFATLFKSRPFIDGLRIYVTGIRQGQNIDYVKLSRSPLPFPPPNEQRAIATFVLDFQRRCNRFIRNRRRLIALLNEQKQVIINRAVTRGLAPHVPLKPSGIEWLGNMPEHWVVRRLKHLLSRPLKYGANEAAELIDRSLPRYIRITDIDKNGNLIDERFRSIRRDLAEPYMVEDGDILLARSGATVGKAFLYSAKYGPAAHAGYLINARVNRLQIFPEYLYTVLQSAGYWQWIASMTIQATIQNVSAEKYSNLYVAVPPLSEQKALLEQIYSETGLLEKMTEKAQSEIDLVREYRTRLIADVVTGKVDVRHLAPSPEDIATMAEAEDLDAGLEDEMSGEDGAELAEEVINADD